MVRSSFRLVAPALGVIAVLFLLSTYSAFKIFNHDPNGCQMSWSRPIYTRLNGFTSTQSRMGSKYSLYMYREGGIDSNEIITSNKNIPVLFIPGNAGSYKQGRSIASYCAKKSAEVDGDNAPKFDFFLADFQEDFTAFHGRTLLDQAQYLNDAIEYILSLYDMANDNAESGLPLPTSVIVIGHSMGGIVARTLLTLPNYIPNSINTIITLSTPHTLPPLTFDKDITVIYDKVNQYWRRAFSNDRTESPLSNVSLISITGGQSDTMVPSDYTAISSLVPESHGFTVFSSSIPSVWTGIDHLAMVWCAQLRQVIVDSLFDIVDVNVSHRTIPLSDRMTIFRKYLLSGFEMETDESHLNITKIIIDYWTGVPQLLDVPHINGKLAIGTLAPNSAVWAPNYLDTEVEGKSPTLLCRLPRSFNQVYNTSSGYIDWSTSSSDPNKDISLLECVDFHHYSAKLPIITDLTARYPFEYTSRTPTLSVKVIGEDEKFPLILHAVNRNTQSHLTIAPSNQILKVKDSLLRLAFVGKSISLRTPFSHISLETVASSLISYRVKLDTAPVESKCSTAQNYFTPFIRQYINEPYESRLHVNAYNGPITIVNHGASPFIPFIPTNSNLHLQVFTPPFHCPDDDSALYSLSISIDLIASLGNLAIRYRTLIASLPVAITSIIFLLQINTYNNKGIFMSFGEALNIFVRGPLIMMLLLLQLLYFALSNSFICCAFLILQIPSERENISALQQFNSNFRQNDIFLGTSESNLWGVVPLLFLVSTGLCYLVYNILKFVIERVCYILLRIKKTGDQDPSEVTTKELGSPLKKSSTTTNRQRIILIIIIAPFILFFVPYQIALLIFFFRQVINTIMILRKVRSGSKINNDNSTISSILSSHRFNNNLYNFSMTITLILLWISIINIPLLVIWIHNLSLQWSIAFSSRNNVLSVLPIILLVQEIASGTMIPRMSNPLQKGFTTVILSYICLYAVLYGFLHTYMLHHLINYLSAWLLVVYFDETGVRNRVGRFLS